MDNSRFYFICEEISKFNGLDFEKNENQVKIYCHFINDEKDEDEMSVPLKNLCKAKKELESSSLYCSKISSNKDCAYFYTYNN